MWNIIERKCNKILFYYILKNAIINCKCVEITHINKVKINEGVIPILHKNTTFNNFKQEGMIILTKGNKYRGWKHIFYKHILPNDRNSFKAFYGYIFKQNLQLPYRTIFTLLLLIHTLKAMENGLTENTYYLHENKLVVDLDLLKIKFEFLPIESKKFKQAILRLIIAKVTPSKNKFYYEILTFYPVYCLKNNKL